MAPLAGLLMVQQGAHGSGTCQGAGGGGVQKQGWGCWQEEGWPGRWGALGEWRGQRWSSLTASTAAELNNSQ